MKEVNQVTGAPRAATSQETATNQSEPLAHPLYRPDIDGLRSVAVLSVVAFHAFPDYLSGGFVGVDLFFVISGFLISTIIFGNLQRNTFSFIEFYSRRVRRIFPALLLTLAFCYAVGWFFLFTKEFQQLNKTILGGATFLSNFILWKSAGYFDTLSYTKPLLHLWSLGIEEQFYIVWPLLLWAAYKARLSPFLLTVIVALVSFFLNIWIVRSNPVAAFYSPLTRFWELLVGSILAWVSLRGPSEGRVRWKGGSLRSAVGMVLIAASLGLITESSTFPGWWALLPTFGAALVISAGRDAWFNRWILSCKPLVWIGLISYPLYLWHWPLLSFVRVIGGGLPSPAVRASAVLAAVLLAWMTFRLVERPVRRQGHAPVVTAALVLLMTLITAVSGFSYRQESKAVVSATGIATTSSSGDGLPRSFTELNPLYMSGADGGDQGFSINDCELNNPADKALFLACLRDSRAHPRFALLGDSKAAALYSGLIRTSSSDGRWLFMGGVMAPVLSNNPIYADSQKAVRVAVDTVKQLPEIDTVVLVAATRDLFQLKTIYSIDDLADNPNGPAAFEALSNVVTELIGAGKKVVLVVDNPTFPDPAECVVRNTPFAFINHRISRERPLCSITLQSQLQKSKKYRQLLENVRAIDPGKIRIFDTLPDLCEPGSGVCSPYKNQRLLYSYSDHISDYAAGIVGADLNRFLQN